MRLMRFLVLCFVSLLQVPTVWAEQDHDQHWDWLVTQARDFDFSPLPDWQAISAQLSIAESCHRAEKEELSEEFRQQAIKRAYGDERRRFDRLLFRHALKIGDIELAREIIDKAEKYQDSLRDQLDVELYRRGNRDVLKTFPREKMTFYNAMDMAAAMVEVGDFAEAEEFVTDIVISEENDPLDVTSLVLSDIAKHYQKEGNSDKAKEYADKALAVGGRQFYTGYTIMIMHKAIHGELLKGLDDFAERGQRYRGRQGAELVQLLIQELYLNGLFDAAKRATKYLEEKEDVHYSLMYLAREQAKRGKVEAALATASEIDDPAAHLLTKARVAQVLHDNERPMLARKLADEVFDTISDLKDEKYDAHRQRLAYFYGQLLDKERISKLVTHSTTPRARVSCLVQAMNAFVGIDPRP